jgi:uncharacterized protein (TIGR02145 family)
MTQIKKGLLWIGISIGYFLPLYGQKVSQIRVDQEGQRVVLYYNLECSELCEVRVYVNTGNEWEGPLQAVSGDIGKKISGGSHRLEWDVLKERNELVGDNIRFKIEAEYENSGIRIGTQVWMTKNLNVDKFRTGEAIPQAKTDEEWKRAGESGEPAWCYYDNNPAKGAVYDITIGKLYNWYAVNDPRGLAPMGWHVPSDREWTVLTEYLGGNEVAGAKMKSETGWFYAGYGSNSSGFSGLPGGYRNYFGPFDDFGSNGTWWSSSTEYSSNGAWYRYLSYKNGSVGRGNHHKGDGFSVRCLRD